MSIRDQLSALLRRYDWQVRIDGRTVPNVSRCSVSMSIDEANATADIVTTERPSWAEESQDLTIWASINGEGLQIFGGETESFDWDYPPADVPIKGVGRLARTRENWGGETKEYIDQTDGAIIINILESYDIHLFSIEDTGWIMGTIDPVIWENGVDGWSIISKIDELTGYRTFEGPDGAVYRRRFTGNPGVNSSFTFTKGVNMFHARRRRSRRGIINQVIVKGIAYEDTEVIASQSAENIYVVNTSGYNSKEIESNWIEDEPKAQEIADRAVGDWNRRPEGIEFDTPYNPLLRLGMTVTVDHDYLEATPTLVVIEALTHTLDRGAEEASTTVSTSGGTLSGYNASAPTAEFTLDLFQEAEEIGGIVSSKIVGVAIFTGFDPDGVEEDLIFEWAVTPTGGTHTLITADDESSLMFTLDEDVTSVLVSLTVTDIDGLSDSVEREEEITGSLTREDLYSAETANIAASSDGQLTWREATPGGNATELMPIAPEWGQLWGSSNGHLYATFDKLQTATVDLGAPNGAVACTAVWVHELSTTRLWAGFNDGKVYFGELNIEAQTATWTLMGIVPEGPVREIREFYDTFNELRVMAGQGYYKSLNGGGIWVEIDDGDTAWRMAAGWGKNFYSFLNDADPLREEGGTTINLPVLVPPVEHIRGVTTGWRFAMLYAVDDQARLFAGAIPPDGSAITLAYVSDAPTGINHMIRSGNEGAPNRDVIYLAGDDGVLKWFGGTDTPFYIRETSTVVEMVSYGDAHGPEIIPSVKFYLITSGLNGATSGVYQYDAGWSGALNSGLPGVSDGKTIYWRRLIADSSNPQRLLLRGNTIDDDFYTVSSNKLFMSDGVTEGLWISEDEGATWAAVGVANISGTGSRAVKGMDYHNGIAYMVANNTDPGQDGDFLWSGDPTSGSLGLQAGTYHPGSHTDDSFWREVHAGLAGDVVIITNEGFFYVASGSGTMSVFRYIWPENIINSDRLGGLYPTLVGSLSISTGTLFRVVDYRSTAYIDTGLNVGGPAGFNSDFGAASAGQGVIYFGARNNSGAGSGGVFRVTDPLGTPAGSIVIGDDITTGHIYVDRQTRTAVACRKLSGAGASGKETYVSEDGITWQTIEGPTAPAGAEIQNWVLVVSGEVAI